MSAPVGLRLWMLRDLPQVSSARIRPRISIVLQASYSLWRDYVLLFLQALWNEDHAYNSREEGCKRQRRVYRGVELAGCETHWTKSALVPIPEGVESCEEEPEEAEEEGLFACGEKKWKDTLGGTVRNDDRNGHDNEEESLAG